MPERKEQKLAKTVGMNIAFRRKRLQMTQAELAEKLGIGADSLSRIEKGLVAPRFPKLEKIAYYLDCSVAELFCSSTDNIYSKSNIIVEQIKSLPIDSQNEILDFLEHAVSVLKK